MTALLPGGEAVLPGHAGGCSTTWAGCWPRSPAWTRSPRQPLAGAHGEMTGIMLIAAYHAARGNKAKKKYVVVPDSSHGTNPASAAMAGYEIITVPTAPYGDMDLDAFKAGHDRRGGGGHDDLPQHPRPVQPAHQGDLRHRPRPRCADVLRRRQPERHHGQGAGRATSASTSSMSTCTRPSARPTAAAVPVPARWASRRS